MTTNNYLTVKNDNPDGHIFVIGDVHGSVDTLKIVLGKLNSNDKLVIVGDLIDRGVSLETRLSASADVLDLIIENNKQAENKQAPYIYSIKGNHEDDVLGFISLLQYFKTGQEKSSDVVMPPLYIEMLVAFIGNGGGWIFNNPVHREAFIAYSQLNKSIRDKHKTRIIELLNESLGHPDTLINNINEYQTLLNGLPYIIKIEDELNSAWVAHADLPFTDTELSTKIAQNQPLTKNEIIHLTTAREGQFSQKRSENTMPVYCGHSPIGLIGTAAVRQATNHINLDSAAYCYSATLLINHTLAKAEVVSAPATPYTGAPAYIAHLKFLDKSKNEIEHHLQTQRLAVKQSLNNDKPSQFTGVVGTFYNQQQNQLKRSASNNLSEEEPATKKMK